MDSIIGTRSLDPWISSKGIHQRLHTPFSTSSHWKYCIGGSHHLLPPVYPPIWWNHRKVHPLASHLFSPVLIFCSGFRTFGCFCGHLNKLQNVKEIAIAMCKFNRLQSQSDIQKMVFPGQVANIWRSSKVNHSAGLQRKKRWIPVSECSLCLVPPLCHCL